MGVQCKTIFDGMHHIHNVISSILSSWGDYMQFSNGPLKLVNVWGETVGVEYKSYNRLTSTESVIITT